jgi:RNase P subunit RPR2
MTGSHGSALRQLFADVAIAASRGRHIRASRGVCRRYDRSPTSMDCPVDAEPDACQSEYYLVLSRRPNLCGNVISLKSVSHTAETTRMTARGCQGEQAHNVVQFPRELKPAPLCAQCHIPMVVVRGEPQPTESATILVTYRCARCGLIERRMMR